MIFIADNGKITENIWTNMQSSNKNNNGFVVGGELFLNIFEDYFKLIIE